MPVFVENGNEQLYCIPSEQILLCNLLKGYNNYTELIIRFTDQGKVEACNLCVEVDYDKLGVYNYYYNNLNCLFHLVLCI